MESMETTLLNKYNIATLFPAQWPEEKDNSSDDDETPRTTASAQPVRRSKSRYSVLESSGSYQRRLPGAERSRDGVENLVQKDEQDPLGSFPSVVQVLRQRGLPVEDDVKLRNRFLLSSTTFSPSLFLSQVHSDASTDSLLNGLDFLSRSIEKKSASLKVLVESNFERFVSAKSTIDRVYNEMRDVGKESESPTTGTRRPSHGRGPSRSSFSSRKPSGQLSPGPLVGEAPNEKKKKNALVKESEYGVHGIKVPLNEVAIKAEEVWGPALNGREKEDNLKAILANVEKNRGMFEVGAAMQDAIRRKDHEAIVEEYTRARRFAEDARYDVEQSNYSQTPLQDAQVHQIIITARMWSDVETQMETFKRECWKRLSSTHFTKNQQATSEEAKSEQYMSIIRIMLEIGVEDNPISSWLNSRYEYLKSRLLSTCERSRVEIEILRRHLANGERPGLRMLSRHLRSVPTSSNVTVEPAKLDTVKVVEFWDHVIAAMEALLSTNGGILGEIVEYWEIVQSFTTGRAQRALPLGYNNGSSVHHKLSSNTIAELERGTTELVNQLREHVYTFFTDPPIEDISLLFSPLPTTPTPTTPRTPLSAALSPTSSSRFRFDPNNVPPPSPSRGETWEKYAFWPPHSNSLSGSHYLAKALVLVGTGANEMASLRLPDNNSLTRLDDQLRVLVVNVRERCVQAICGVWNTDADKLKVLEDWTRQSERNDITNMPTRFLAVQSFLLSNLQKTMYVTGSEGSSKTAVDVVVPPSNKLLQLVRTQFVTSLYRTLSGMVESAEKGRAALGKEYEVQSDDLTIDESQAFDEGDSWSKVDANQQPTRLLLTLSNMASLHTEITPQLISNFEALFSVALTDETARIKDVLTQLDAQLFKSYTKPHLLSLSRTIQAGIFSPSWAPTTPPGKSVANRDPSSYVFTVLLALVIVHTEVSTTSPPLTPRILRALFEHSTEALITTFRALEHCSLDMLMQATLDVEFMAQTLNAYTTETASQIQTEIYQVLDQKTDNAARVQLQEELGNLRGVLKRLREGTRGQFGCFRRVGRRGEGR